LIDNNTCGELSVYGQSRFHTKGRDLNVPPIFETYYMSAQSRPYEKQ